MSPPHPSPSAGDFPWSGSTFHPAQYLEHEPANDPLPRFHLSAPPAHSGRANGGAAPDGAGHARPADERPLPPSPFSLPPPPIPRIRSRKLTVKERPRRFSSHPHPAPSSTSRSKSLLEKTGRRFSSGLAPLRSPGRPKRFSLGRTTRDYGVIEESEEVQVWDARRQKPAIPPRITPKSDEENAFDDVVGYDLTTFEGPASLGQDDRRKAATAGDVEPGQQQAHDALAAEFYQLEADDTFQHGLGGGMAVAQLRLEPSGKTADGWRADGPGDPLRGMDVSDVGRMEAKKLNAMVVINADPPVDMTSFDVDHPDHHTAGFRPDQTKNSYYFPPDPEKPNWKPYCMRWPYLTSVILLSVVMAGAQEYLYQVGVRRQARGDGLLKFVWAQDVPTGEFFCWKYLPTMVAVTYGIAWQVVDFDVKRLEPYYQLSRPEGATAAESLNLDYVTCWVGLVPFMAARHRQWAVLCSSLVHLLSALVPVLQNASVIVVPGVRERLQHPDQAKCVVMHPVWSRLLSGALLLLALLGCLMLYQLRRTSGLLSDPKGIAGVAAMANKSFILMDFKDLDTARPAAIHDRLKHRRYNLHKSSLWQGEYLTSGDARRTERQTTNPHPVTLRLVFGVPYIAFLAAMMGAVPMVMFIPALNQAVQHVPWLLTALASLVKVLWMGLDGSVRVMEPFYLLSRRRAPSRTLTLDYRGHTPGWRSLQAFVAGHWLVGLVGLGALLTEVLTVTASSLSGRAGVHAVRSPHPGPAGASDASDSETTFTSVWVSLGLTQAILGWLLISACLVYVRRRHPFLPREPGSIASVLAFVHQSKMLVDFVDTERFTHRQMTAHLRRIGKTYGLGWFKGRDGLDHCGIDEEPLVTEYKHGLSHHHAVKPWSKTWDRYD
ncbi:MAG: hypothetical protein M1826_003822 [Phylliscum demangeonii]|nr:MAG: hypothetical protein M1826_003822 [Phylliscum demangeonii]